MADLLFYVTAHGGDMKELILALSKAQGEFDDPKKNKEAPIKGVSKAGKEYSYTYKYADLAEIRKATQTALTKYELAICSTFGSNTITTTLAHSSGQVKESVLPLNTSKAPQALGSDITYFRRYQVCAMLGIAADEDDDGKMGNDAHKKPKPIPKLVSKNHLEKLYKIGEKHGWTEKDIVDLTLKHNLKGPQELNLNTYSQFCSHMAKNPIEKTGQGKNEKPPTGQTTKKEDPKDKPKIDNSKPLCKHCGETMVRDKEFYLCPHFEVDNDHYHFAKKDMVMYMADQKTWNKN